MKGYYFITDATLSKAGIINDVKDALRAGVKVVQYRNKYLSAGAAYQEALLLRRLCKDICFIINDRVDIAFGVGADGVHLGQDDLPYAAARKLLGKNKIIGITVHTLTQAIAAEKNGANYLGVSPIFSTHTKFDAGKPVGLKMLSAIRKRVALPLVAIGGITLANAPSVIGCGADAVCALSAVLSGSGVREKVEKFQKLYQKYARQVIR